MQGTQAGCCPGAMRTQLATSIERQQRAPVAAPRDAPTARRSHPLVQRALAGLGGSELARQVLGALERSGARIDTMADGEFAREFGARTKGAFVPSENRIVLPRSVAADPERLRLVLLHEGVHWLQDNVAGGAEGLGGPIADALAGAGAIRSTRPNSRADLHHDETQAYLLEALVARELGIRDTGMGTDAETGRVLDYDAVIARIRATAEYA